MQLTMIDNTLLVYLRQRMIHSEPLHYARVAAYLITCGYRPATAQAIAYGILNDKEKTIALGKLIKLLQN